MAPLSDRLFEFNNAALFRIYRLFLTGVEVTQAIQHYGAAEHLTDAADRGADNSLRLVVDKPAWVRVYDCAPDTYLAQSFVPDVAPGAALEISDGKTTLWERKAPKTPVQVSAFSAKVQRDGSITANWTTAGEATGFWLRYSTDGETWRVASTGTGERSTKVPAGVLPSGKLRLQLVAHDGFYSSRSKSVALAIPARAADIAILHPRDGYTYVEGQSLRLWGSAVGGDAGPVAPEHCYLEAGRQRRRARRGRLHRRARGGNARTRVRGRGRRWAE